MEIGVSTACFYPTPTEHIPELLQRIGVTKAEVFLNSESEYEADFCLPLKESLDAKGIEAVSVHSFVAQHEPFLFSDYPRRVQDAEKIYRKVLKATSMLGAKYHTFHGARKEMLGKYFDVDGYVKTINRLADIAGEYGIKLALENVSWCVSCDVELWREILPKLTSEHLGFTLDLKQARRADFNYFEYASLFSDRILNVHISDANAESDCLLPGDGNVNFSAVFSRLQSLGYKGDCIIEVYNQAIKSEDHVAKSVAYLQNIANQSIAKS